MVALIAPFVLTSLIACDASTDPDPGTPVDLTYAACRNAADVPLWLAVQDGDGEWTRVNATNGAFNFTLTQGKGGVATFTSENGLRVTYATTDELVTMMPSCNGASVRSVSGTVSDYALLDDISLQMGDHAFTVQGSDPAPAAFSIDEVDAGVTDLVGIRFRTAAGTQGFESYPDRVVLRRGISGSTTPEIDFGSTPDVFTPVQRSLNVTNVMTGETVRLYSNVALGTTMGNIAIYQAATAQFPGAVSVPFYGLTSASGALAAGESQMLLVQAFRSTSSTVETRVATVVYTDAADKAVTLGPSLGPITIAGSSHPSATYTIQDEYDNIFDVAFQQDNGTSSSQVEILMTRSYLGAGATVTLGVPDLSGASGFQAAWLPVRGSSAIWSFVVTGADVSALNMRPVTYLAADRSGIFTP
jgi:hypothetical protein